MAPHISETATLTTSGHGSDSDSTEATTKSLVLKRGGKTLGQALLDSRSSLGTDPHYQMEVVWGNVAKFVVLHAFGAAGMLLLPNTSWQTLAFAFVCYVFSTVSVTAGSHRLWTHRSYKASLPLKLLLAIGNSLAAENSIYVWCRDHRVHHKFSETDADPHNSNRGFFFAHMGWLMVRKHPEVTRQGAKINLKDLEEDPVVMFQHKHYLLCMLLFCILVPTLIPWYFWDESLTVSYCNTVLRYLCVLHATWLVNSAAHFWGDKPYDVNIAPAENKLVSLFAVGEGFHNYHHSFPSDYSASEWRWSLNLTTLFIDVMAFLGLAWDRRTLSKENLSRRIDRTGPGSQPPLLEEEKDF